MTSPLQLLIALGIGLAWGVTGLIRNRNNTGLREQIKQDIELRELLNEPPSSDDEARTALTLSVRKNAQALISDKRGWFDRWGMYWMLPVGLTLFFVGTVLIRAVDDFEGSPETQLALEVAGQTLNSIAGALGGLWLGQVVLIPFISWLANRKPRRAESRSPQAD